MTRTIGIGGCSFCGSTLLDRCLSRLPDTVALGETHWLVDQTNASGRRLDVCGQHGAACSTFTERGRAKLRRGGFDRWWPRLSAFVGDPDFIVSADKNPSNWKRLGPPDVFLVPYRETWSMVDSFVRRQRTYALGEIPRAWDWIRSTGVPFVTIDTDRLPETLRPAVEALGLPWSDDALAPWDADSCVIGGNGARNHGFGRTFKPATITSGSPSLQDAADAIARGRDQLLAQEAM